MEDKEESLDNPIQYSEDQSQNLKVNHPCVSNAVHLNEDKCNVNVSDHTEENSVESTVRSNTNLFSQTVDKRFRSNILCKSVTSKLHQHTKEIHFKSNICSKSFSMKGNLATHTCIHTNKKSFHCRFCNK